MSWSNFVNDCRKIRKQKKEARKERRAALKQEWAALKQAFKDGFKAGQQEAAHKISHIDPAHLDALGIERFQPEKIELENVEIQWNEMKSAYTK